MKITVISWQTKKTGKTMYRASDGKGRQSEADTEETAIQMLRARRQSDARALQLGRRTRKRRKLIPEYIAAVDRFVNDYHIPPQIGAGNGHKAVTTNSYYREILWDGIDTRNPISIRISDHAGHFRHEIEVNLLDDEIPTPDELYTMIERAYLRRIAGT